ncbi:unnamed protein product [Rotaria sp. Silwood1]|nr:unnamed protein product [Rotaria sp. Silwood1]
MVVGALVAGAARGVVDAGQAGRAHVAAGQPPRAVDRSAPAVPQGRLAAGPRRRADPGRLHPGREQEGPGHRRHARGPRARRVRAPEGPARLDDHRKPAAADPRQLRCDGGRSRRRGAARRHAEQARPGRVAAVHPHAGRALAPGAAGRQRPRRADPRAAGRDGAVRRQLGAGARPARDPRDDGLPRRPPEPGPPSGFRGRRTLVQAHGRAEARIAPRGRRLDRRRLGARQRQGRRAGPARRRRRTDRHRPRRAPAAGRARHRAAAQAHRLRVRPGRGRLRAGRRAVPAREPLDGRSVRHQAQRRPPPQPRARRPAGHRLHRPARADTGRPHRPRADRRGLRRREGIPRARRVRRPARRRAGARGHAAQRRTVQQQAGAAEPRPGAGRRTAQARQGQLAERTSAALRAARGQEAPDPPHVRADGGVRDAARQLRRRAGRGAGAEQAAVGHAVAAAGGAAPGRAGGQVHQQLPDGGGLRVRGRQARAGRPVGLRLHQRAGPAEPRGRRGRGAAVRRAVRDADLAEPHPARAAQPDAGRRVHRHHGAKRTGLRRPDGRCAGQRGPAAQRHRDGAEPPADARAVPQYRAEDRHRRRHRAPARRGPRGTGRGKLRHRVALQRQASRGPGRQAGHRRQRTRDGQGRRGGAEAHGKLHAAGHEGRRGLRQHALRRGVHPRGGEDADRSRRAGVPGDVPVPTELPRHADPDDRRAGGAAGHVRRHGRGGLLHQHADDVRPGAGHRPAGGRCHRRGGKRRARDDRGGPVARGGHAQVHEPDHRRAGRHRPRAVGRVRADGLLRRVDGRHLPPVLDHHRVGHGAVGVRRAGADTGAVRHAAEAGPRPRHPRLLRCVQPPLRQRRQRLPGRRRPHGGALGPSAGGVRPHRRRHGELGRGDERGGRDRVDVAVRHRPELDRPVLPGAPDRRPGAHAVRAVAAGGVPVPGRAIRELEHPVLGDAGGAAGRHRRAAGGHAARAVQRRVLPGRPADHHRPVGEERDPDRRVRQGADGGRQGRRLGHAGGRAPAAAPHPDDVAGVRTGRAAAGHRHRRRLGQPERHRHRRAGRHVERHRARPVLRARVLRRCAALVPGAHQATGRRTRGDPGPGGPLT